MESVTLDNTGEAWEPQWVGARGSGGNDGTKQEQVRLYIYHPVIDLRLPEEINRHQLSSAFNRLKRFNLR